MTAMPTWEAAGRELLQWADEHWIWSCVILILAVCTMVHRLSARGLDEDAVRRIARDELRKDK